MSRPARGVVFLLHAPRVSFQNTANDCTLRLAHQIKVRGCDDHFERIEHIERCQQDEGLDRSEGFDCGDSFLASR